MQYVFAALTCIFAVGYATVKDSGTLFSRLFFKCAASVMFVLIAYSAGTGSSQAYHGLIMLGLCLSLVGDVLFVFSEKKYMITGVVFFFFAHAAYITAFMSVTPLSLYDAVFFAVLITIGAAAFRNKLRRPYRLKIGGIVYAIVLCAMTARAMSMLFAPHAEPIYIVFAAAGAVLFALFDMSLAYGWLYPKGKRCVGKSGTIAYYAAQVLIALSVMM